MTVYTFAGLYNSKIHCTVPVKQCTACGMAVQYSTGCKPMRLCGETACAGSVLGLGYIKHAECAVCICRMEMRMYVEH